MEKTQEQKDIDDIKLLLVYLLNGRGYSEAESLVFAAARKRLGI